MFQAIITGKMEEELKEIGIVLSPPINYHYLGGLKILLHIVNIILNSSNSCGSYC